MKPLVKSHLVVIAAAVFVFAVAVVQLNQSALALRQDPANTQDSSRNPTSTQQQDDVLRVDSELVTTLFTALDRDRHFVTSLRQEDLRVFEDGVEQEITQFERETDRPLIIVVLIDTSKSQEFTLPNEKKAARQFVESVVRPAKDKVAVVAFNGAPKMVLPASSDVSVISAGIDRVEIEIPAAGCDAGIPVTEDPRCWTSIWDSVLTTSKGFAPSKRIGTRRAIILLSDGHDSSSRFDRDDAIKSAVANDVTIYGIGIGDRNYGIKKDDLRKLAEKTGGQAFFPREDAELASAFAQIQEELRSQYVIAYSPKNKAHDGSFRKVKLEIVTAELRKRKLQLLHRQGYYARKD